MRRERRSVRKQGLESEAAVGSKMGPISRLATRDGESHFNPTKSCRATITAMGLSMQTDQAITFAALQPGHVFRFHHRDKVAIELKAQFAFGTRDHAAVILKPTHYLPFGELVGASEVGDAVLLGGAKILPSAKPKVQSRPERTILRSRGKSSFAARVCTSSRCRTANQWERCIESTSTPVQLPCQVKPLRWKSIRAGRSRAATKRSMSTSPRRSNQRPSASELR